MSHPEVPQTTPENSWLVIRIAYWLAEKIKRGFVWLFPKKEVYPENESGELMRRALAHKDWFDKLSSWWVEQSFLVKMTVFAGIALSSVLVGLWAGIPVLLTLSSLFIFTGVHVLLVAHEHHRIEQAKIFAEEAMELNEDLEASKKLLDEAASTVNYAADELNGHSARMQENATTLEKESQAIHEQKELLSIRVDEMKDATTGLIAQEKEVHQVLEQAFAHIHILDTKLIKTTEHVEGIENASAQFSESVKGIQASQNAYADAVTRFGIFVAEQKTQAKPQTSVYSVELHDDLDVELDENDHLIAKMKASMFGVSA